MLQFRKRNLLCHYLCDKNNSVVYILGGRHSMLSHRFSNVFNAAAIRRLNKKTHVRTHSMLNARLLRGRQAKPASADF